MTMSGRSELNDTPVGGVSQMLLQKTKGRKNRTPKTGSNGCAHPAADETLNQ